MVLVANDSRLLDIMCQFESRSLNHTFLSATESLIFKFPRFDLSLELRDGKLYSQAYLGYYLAPCQHLDDQLLGFKNYMILQQDDGRIASPRSHCLRPGESTTFLIGHFPGAG